MLASVTGVFLEMGQNWDNFLLDIKKGLGKKPRPCVFAGTRAGIESIISY
jgi:hypothetical protein